MLYFTAYTMMALGVVLIFGTIYAEYRHFLAEIARVQDVIDRLRGKEIPLSIRDILAELDRQPY